MSYPDLTRAFDEAAGHVPTWCPTCRGPRTDLGMIVWLHRGERIGRCPACEGATHPDGSSVRRWNSEGLSEVPYWSCIEDYLERYPDAAPFDTSMNWPPSLRSVGAGRADDSVASDKEECDDAERAE